MTLRPVLLPLVLCSLAALGCSKGDTLTVKPGEVGAPEFVPSPQLEKFAYKKILLLPFDAEIAVEGIDSDAITKQSGPYYVSKIEKALLGLGFEVISPEIVARASKSLGKGVSTAEKAMMMGKETQAHAVFIVQSIIIEPLVDYYAVDELDTRAVPPAKVDQNLKNGQFFEKETKDCVYRLGYYEVRLEAKLIDVRSGNVLWVGSGRQTAIQSLPESYVAQLDKECKLEGENFVFTDRIAGEGHLAATFNDLVGQLLKPLKIEAHKGKAIATKKAKPKPKKEVAAKPPKKEEAKKVTAVVSTKRASVRAGPGKKNERLRFVSRKTKVVVLETMGEWNKVELQDGTKGWMHESTIIVND
ncbi:MAG: SH3 domain-containing protein [Nannocystaceae bacterium]|nr:SH3 domain-containing protein [Nannocystaceae bacterium]